MSFHATLDTYLILALFLLMTGIYGMIRHKTFIGMLISTELVLNGAGLNFMAFNKFLAPDPAVGQIFTLFIMGIAAAEAAIAISFILAVYRKFSSGDPRDVTDLKG
ncbi:NADH-quinone oxidoreductase subunit NuoK [Desulfoluna butyratoxydans]|uniref:NADH-quinone oxidoreductase subunit K n=1 Tax=Desulfoluna butyratoxydans TaxID=231438 RepID=A0A4U8YWG0_9BACT|nr:NADH-quinone oxidoreductase subunit NuoK [Desulfoluna butyratoxydans]VFQ45753.1 nadh-ubiquinone/plastoquinone oxidoreductase chain 4l [Desulfoluna butyratoxydans]